MKKRTTIDDVAREAGVSRQTVSRAINGMGGISANTRDRVMEMVDEMGFQPSRFARGMAGRQTQTIGLVIGNLTNPARAEIFQSLYNTAAAEHYNIFVRSTDYQPSQELRAMQSLISENVDGIVIISPTLPEDQLAEFADKDCPIVVVHREVIADHVSSITTDVVRATKSVVEYLMGAGHTHIGLITRNGALEAIRHVRGYKNALHGRGFPSNLESIVQDKVTLKGGYSATLKLLSQHPDISAIVAYDDLMALGAMKACKELGHRIPDDIAIMGYNDIPFAAFCSPTLSTIRINGREVGQRAFSRIKEMIARPEVEFPPAVLDIDLVIRESTNRQ